MSRFCHYLAPCDQVEASGRDDVHRGERAAIDAAGALRIASGCVRRASGQRRRRWRTACRAGAAPGSRRSRAAAGRDLLDTHLAADPDGLTRARSEWASAVTSILSHVAWCTRSHIVPAARAVHGVARCLCGSRRPAGHAQPGCPGLRTGRVRGRKPVAQAAGRCAPALDADPAGQPMPTAVSDPRSHVPQRRRPGRPGGISSRLCDGITISASGARRDARQPGPGPVVA